MNFSLGAFAAHLWIAFQLHQQHLVALNQQKHLALILPILDTSLIISATNLAMRDSSELRDITHLIGEHGLL